jgi:hypothetical protein
MLVLAPVFDRDGVNFKPEGGLFSTLLMLPVWRAKAFKGSRFKKGLAKLFEAFSVSAYQVRRTAFEGA